MSGVVGEVVGPIRSVSAAAVGSVRFGPVRPWVATFGSAGAVICGCPPFAAVTIGGNRKRCPELYGCNPGTVPTVAIASPNWIG